MKTLMYSAWTCAVVSGMILVAIHTLSFVPIAKREVPFYVAGASISFLFWIAISFFLHARKQWQGEPPHWLRVTALGLAAAYMLLFLALFA